jgi:hypothetical protein
VCCRCGTDWSNAIRQSLQRVATNRLTKHHGTPHHKQTLCRDRHNRGPVQVAIVSPVRSVGPNAPRFLNVDFELVPRQAVCRRSGHSCVSSVKRLIRFHNKRHPRHIGPLTVKPCLTHLADNRMVSASTRNQALRVIHFICHEVLRRDPVRFGEVARTKRPRRLPTAFACDEAQGVRAQLDGTCGLTARLLYGSGRRLMECLPLRMEEVDFTRRTLFVRRSTGSQAWTPIHARGRFATGPAAGFLRRFRAGWRGCSRRACSVVPTCCGSAVPAGWWASHRG